MFNDHTFAEHTCGPRTSEKFAFIEKCEIEIRRLLKLYQAG